MKCRFNSGATHAIDCSDLNPRERVREEEHGALFMGANVIMVLAFFSAPKRRKLPVVRGFLHIRCDCRWSQRQSCAGTSVPSSDLCRRSPGESNLQKMVFAKLLMVQLSEMSESCSEFVGLFVFS